MVYFNKKDKSKTSETNNCQNENKASIIGPTGTVEQTTKRAYLDKLSVNKEGNENTFKEQNGKFVKEYNKKYLELGFSIASCSKQLP